MMEKLEKQTVSILLPNHFNWGGSTSIADIQADLQELIAAGATHITMFSDDDDVGMDAYIERLETDEEFEARKAKRAYFAQRKIESDLRMLADLKAQYED